MIGKIIVNFYKVLEKFWRECVFFNLFEEVYGVFWLKGNEEGVKEEKYWLIFLII